MSDCFYIANIYPQKHAFNAGIWEQLENKARSWTIQYDSTAVYCGPVMGTITHEGNLNVPMKFYKIIYSVKHHKAIAFIMDSDISKGDKCI
jgi:endonuclease G, mitochondrial